MSDTLFSPGTVVASTWLNDVNTVTYKAQSGIAGTNNRTAISKFSDYITLKDFGAIGTAVPGNVTADTSAFITAAASGKDVHLPEGTYYLSSSITIGSTTKFYGDGQGKTIVIYTGTGTAFTLGDTSTSIVLRYYPELRDMTIQCTNRASTVNGVVLNNGVYFSVKRLEIIGSGNPNSGVPADWVLYGAGLTVSNNSILGVIEQVSCRLWNYGYYFYTKSLSASHWSAAISVQGGEVANNMYGIMVGDSTVGFSTAVGVKFDSVWVQGNYTTGIRNYSGESTLFDNIYFEGNANYDYDQGGGSALPVKCRVTNSIAASESIGTTNYGTFPYLAKIRIRAGSFTSIVDNDLSISTAIPLVTVDSGVTEASIIRNRLNSTAATTARISNASGSTITADNSPEAPRVAVSSLTRTLNTASGSVSYTGLGFKPTSIEFWGAVDTTPESFIGSAGVGVGIVQRCMTIDASNNKLSSGDCIRLIKTGAGNEQKATLTSFDADGFTLSWTKVGAPPANDLVVNYIARR